jgi:hypothetical protein
VKGATAVQPDLRCIDFISIHAPVKGATFSDQSGSGLDVISIHAPVKGATRLWLLPATQDYFNPRTREGCDMESDFYALRVKKDFNPRTREGCDDDWPMSFVVSTEFQSTHP